MALSIAEIHLVALGASVAAGCRGCISHRARRIASVDEWAHAIALGAQARERARRGSASESDVEAGGVRHYHGLYYRPVLEPRVALCVQLAAYTAAGAPPHELDAVAQQAGVPEDEWTQAVALGYRAVARAAIDLAETELGVRFKLQNAKNQEAWAAAGGPVHRFPGIE